MRKFKYIAMSIGTLVLTLTLATSAFASSSGATSTIGGTVTAGGLSVSDTTGGTFSDIAINGTNQTTHATLPINVNDSTGSGAGWNLTLTSTTLTQGTHPLTDSVSTIDSVGAAPSDLS